MKPSRSSYLIMIGFLFLFLLITIEQFSEKVGRIITLPFFIVTIILVITGSIVAIKDKEFIRTMTDERTKKVDRSAGYYSWWITILFVLVFGFIADIKGFTIRQIIATLLTEMFLTFIILHMYFYFKGQE